MVKRKVLVTGAMGFIGANLVEKLLKDNKREVMGIDNFCSSKRDRLEELDNNLNFSFLERDVMLPIEIDRNIDEIYHLACPGRHPPHVIIENPLLVLQTNVDGTRNILDLAKEKGAKMLHFSSSEVYGIPAIFPTPETYLGNVNPLGERGSYDESKRFCDAYCKAFKDRYGVDVKIVRPFNFYGRYMDEYDGRVIPLFIQQALRNEPLTVYGDGSHTRSFCYISDAIEGIVKMMESEQGFMGPVNIGNPEEIDIESLAKKIIELTESESTIDHSIDFPSDDPHRRIPDIALARNKLGWKPQVSLNKGLKKTIRYYRKLLKD